MLRKVIFNRLNEARNRKTAPEDIKFLRIIFLSILKHSGIHKQFEVNAKLNKNMTPQKYWEQKSLWCE